MFQTGHPGFRNFVVYVHFWCSKTGGTPDLEHLHWCSKSTPDLKLVVFVVLCMFQIRGTPDLELALCLIYGCSKSGALLNLELVACVLFMDVPNLGALPRFRTCCLCLIYVMFQIRGTPILELDVYVLFIDVPNPAPDCTMMFISMFQIREFPI
jgi:hypothetical protein